MRLDRKWSPLPQLECRQREPRILTLVMQYYLDSAFSGMERKCEIRNDIHDSRKRKSMPIMSAMTVMVYNNVV